MMEAAQHNNSVLQRCEGEPKGSFSLLESRPLTGFALYLFSGSTLKQSSVCYTDFGLETSRDPFVTWYVTSADVLLGSS